MSNGTWRDRLAGHRMQVDEQFATQVRESPLTNGEWNLVMTAVEFEVEGQGEGARLTADTTKVESVVPEFEKMRQRGPGGGGGRPESANSVIDSVKGVLGIDSFNDIVDLKSLENRLDTDLTGPLGLDSGMEDDEKFQAAVRLSDAYAQELQSHLEERGQWESIREAATQPSPE
jgi:hypothetical protein